MSEPLFPQNLDAVAQPYDAINKRDKAVARQKEDIVWKEAELQLWKKKLSKLQASWAY